MFSRRPNGDDDVTDDEDARSIDPELRLRTVRTAASTLAESAAVEQRAEKRRTLMMNRKKKKGSFFRRGSGKKRPAQDSVSPAAPVIPGQRRTIYVNRPLPMSEVDSKNEPLVRYPRNKVRTTSELLPLSPTPLPETHAFSRIYHPYVYTKEPVRTVSQGGEHLFLGTCYPPGCVTFALCYLETPQCGLIRFQCFLCLAPPPRKLRHSPSYLLSLSLPSRTGSKIIVAPRSTRKSILPARLNWGTGRTSTARQIPANGSRSCLVSIHRGRLQKAFRS